MCVYIWLGWHMFKIIESLLFKIDQWFQIDSICRLLWQAEWLRTPWQTQLRQSSCTWQQVGGSCQLEWTCCYSHSKLPESEGKKFKCCKTLLSAHTQLYMFVRNQTLIWSSFSWKHCMPNGFGIGITCQIGPTHSWNEWFVSLFGAKSSWKQVANKIYQQIYSLVEQRWYPYNILVLAVFLPGVSR